jgi:hypothetical protein
MQVESGNCKLPEKTKSNNNMLKASQKSPSLQINEQPKYNPIL